MAFTTTVTELREGRQIDFSGSADNVAVSWSTQYAVDVSDPTDPTFSGATINPYLVATADGLPVVNRSIYRLGAGEVIPFVICRKKTAAQLPNRVDRWIVTCEFSAFNRTTNDENNNQPITVPDTLAELGTQEVPSLGETDWVIYYDNQDIDNGEGLPTGAYIANPIGDLYDEPAVQRLPTLEIKLTQYESSITYEQMLSRKFKVNSGTYRGQSRYSWLISQVEATEVEVQLRSGIVEAALVTYTLNYTPRPNGWKEERLLVGTHYWNNAVDKKRQLFFDEQLGVSYVGNLNPNGTRASDQKIAQRAFYETYLETDFSSFLQA